MGAGTGVVIVGELIMGQVGDFSQYLNVVGDGTTKIFNFAHGLNAAPNRYFVVPQTYNAAAAIASNAPVVTVTSTNIVLTYATAPANAATLGYAARYA